MDCEATTSDWLSAMPTPEILLPAITINVKKLTGVSKVCGAKIFINDTSTNVNREKNSRLIAQAKNLQEVSTRYLILFYIAV